MREIYKKIQVIPVNQPLGVFYLCSMPSDLLLEVSYPDQLTITGIDDRTDTLYKLSGNQRAEVEEKRKQIGQYIDGVEATFPNTVILGANVDKDGNPIDDIEQRWEATNENGVTYLTIPVKRQNARVIDGQHRLNGFRLSQKNVTFEIPCAVFLDLPLSIQASIFATININQKKVDRSLAFELFGYDLDEEPSESWSPEKLGIFITRKLNVDLDSPFKGHIKVEAKYSRLVFNQENWSIATSVLVDGIMSLFSSDPIRDRGILYTKPISERKRDKLLKNDSSPLRRFYLDNNDKFVYTLVLNYFRAVADVFPFDQNNAGYIYKSVGIQALFDVLKVICKTALEEKKISVQFFKDQLLPASNLNFGDLFFQASGIGRSRIKNVLLLAMDLLNIEKIKEKDRQYYQNLLATRPTIEDQEKWIWEDEAELDVKRSLEHADWNYKKKAVAISVGPEDREVEFNNYDNFYSKLIEIAEESAAANMPGDQEMRNAVAGDFDPAATVNEVLEGYQEQLHKLGWV